MKKILVLILASVSLSSFASATGAAVSNIAESVAMADCLKTKTKLECNAMQKAGSKAVQAEKNKVEQQ